MEPLATVGDLERYLLKMVWKKKKYKHFIKFNMLHINHPKIIHLELRPQLSSFKLLVGNALGNPCCVNVSL